MNASQLVKSDQFSTIVRVVRQNTNLKSESWFNQTPKPGMIMVEKFIFLPVNL